MNHWLAAAIAFVVSGVLVMVLRRPARRVGLVDRPGGRKQHYGSVPIIGGLTVFVGYLVGLSLTGLPPQAFLAGALVLLGTGVIDDVRGMPAWVKLLVQLLAAGCLVLWAGMVVRGVGTYPFVGELGLGPFAIPLTLIAVVGLINGVNMLDGVDGLAGGVSLAAFAWLFAIALMSGQSGTATTLVPLLGAVAAFLMFNMRNPWRRKASVFLGDAGSMMLGFVMAWCAVELATGQDRVSPAGIAWVVALPVIDTVSLMARRLLKGTSPFAPDREHLHHIFQRAGYQPRAIAALLTAATAAMGLVGVGGSIVGVPDGLLVLGLVAVALAHFVFIKTAWRTMRALRRARAQPAALLGARTVRPDVAPELPCWRRRLGLLGLYTAVATAPFPPFGVLAGFALVVVATLSVWPLFWRDVRSLPVAWVAVLLGFYVAGRGVLAPMAVETGGLHWGDIFRVTGLLSIPLAWWLAACHRHWRGLLLVLLAAGTVNLAVEVDWQAVRGGDFNAPFSSGDSATSGMINTGVLLFLVAGMVAAVRRLGRGWRPACQLGACLAGSVPLVFLLVTSQYATAWLGLLAGLGVLAFLAVWYGITRRQWAGLSASVALIAVLGGAFYGTLVSLQEQQQQLTDPLRAGMLILEGRPGDASAIHEATVDRLRSWADGLGVLADRFWLGTGSPGLAETAGVAGDSFGNLYLAIAVGFGFVGLGLFGLLALILARDCVCAVRERVWPGEVGMALLSVGAAFTAMFLFVAPVGQLLPRAAVVMLMALMMSAAFERRWAAQAGHREITHLAPVQRSAASDLGNSRSADRQRESA